jgi:subtilisin family serine protease
MDLRAALELNLRALGEQPLEPVVVSVVDSGVDGTHPDLRGRIAEASRVEDGPGGPVAHAQPHEASNDVYGHGTAVAGIIAGVAPNARISDIRVLDERNQATGHVLVEGFRRAVESDARVINLSLACRARFAPELHELCERAYRRNQIVVAAKRNMPLVDQGFPAELSACIAVDRERYPSPFDLGYRPTPPIEFIGRGVDVTAPAPGGGFQVVTGTSFATPAVSGLCALLLGIAPDLRPFEVKALLKGLAR